MEWLKEILKGLEGAEDLEKKIAGGIGKNSVSKDDFNTLNTTKKKLESDIVSLKADLENGDDFKGKFEALERQVKADKAAAEQATKEAKEHEEYQNRFNSAVGEQKWRDELTGNAVFSEFRKALADETNKGKGDKDILDLLVKDKNYFDNPNKPTDMPGMGSVSMTDVEENQMRAIMGLAPKA
ncbi:hypothetical protein [Anaerotignum propionicum]|uniref:phage scaffolding protein n=1 Tax=Anaerotignum propionicum TaxID=28446 RepID=UPI00289CA4C3|nr:hypothetical protein [Anaerotignum propionicum]